MLRGRKSRKDNVTMIIAAIEITQFATVITPLCQCRTQQTDTTVSPDVYAAIGAMACPFTPTKMEGEQYRHTWHKRP